MPSTQKNSGNFDVSKIENFSKEKKTLQNAHQK